MAVDDGGREVDELAVVGPRLLAQHLEGRCVVDRVAFHEDALRAFGQGAPPECPFAIDPHPFQDADGRWYLFYATDFLDTEGGARAGTALPFAITYDTLLVGQLTIGNLVRELNSSLRRSAAATGRASAKTMRRYVEKQSGSA